ncbi:CDP-diacylglycerol-serine O-phosphatidyltransferase [Piptocephalis cylindrospora]|uniref:CDP-diacylglycerol--serine O-phosphatidyltransferase n=1 Tax=Piptocephalis cylindrospora TaxID=1907219 RepID=A0A4P9Y4A7_9FUNG|nr:CDP-diacylglycerol-serine O-phosphatidyltransferase [Piptocephalis cylindrospora]|eukprot:RKP13683.1 CDP-diacylglycerol-serine O-phosphatidyltransferase [Piptocephalis cylindrospora]
MPSSKQNKRRDEQARLLDPTDEYPVAFSMVRSFHLADLLTLSNAACGFLSCLACLAHLVSLSPELVWASVLMPLGGMFDVLDGRVARWRYTSSLLGQELDSLADLISFGVGPAMLAFTMGYRSVLDTFLLTFFVGCAVARLARYNATVASLPKDKAGKVKYFEGTPVPTSLLLVVLLSTGGSIGLDGVLLSSASLPLIGSVHTVSVLYGIIGAGMVSRRLRIPKM